MIGHLNADLCDMSRYGIWNMEFGEEFGGGQVGCTQMGLIGQFTTCDLQTMHIYTTVYII